MDKEYSKTIEIPLRGFTHGSKFHSDDVFATAFLKILNPGIEITRGFEVPENFDGIVYDIGRGGTTTTRQIRSTVKTAAHMLHLGLYGVNLVQNILAQKKQKGLTGILSSH